MRSSLFTLFLLSLEAAPGSSLRIPLPLQSPSSQLADSSGKRIGARWNLDLAAIRAIGNGIEKRHQGHSNDNDGGNGDGGTRRPRPHKNGGQVDGDEVARVMNANDGRNDEDDKDHDQEDEQGERPKGKGKGREQEGKKQKHEPGSHHRDDRHPPTEDKHAKHRSHKEKGKGKHEKRYLSSNPRYHTKKELSFWDYDRHTKRMGEFDPLHGTGLRKEAEMQQRGHGADERHGKVDGDERHVGDAGGGGRGRHGKHGEGGGGRADEEHGREKHEEDDPHKSHSRHSDDREEGEDGQHKKDNHQQDKHHITSSDVRGQEFHVTGPAAHIDRPQINAVNQDGQVRGDSLPNRHDQDHIPAHRQGVTLGDGISAQSKSLASTAHTKDHPDAVDEGPVHNQARGLLDPLRVDDMLGLEYEAYDCEDEYGLGQHTLFGRDEGQNQTNAETTPGPPQSVSVVDGGPRLFSDRIIWQPQSDHPEKHGGLKRRRKNKHGDDEDDNGAGGGKHGGGRGNDDEDDYESSRGKHRGGDEEDDYGSSSSKKGNGRYDDEGDGESDYSTKSSSGRAKGKGNVDDADDVPYSKSNPLSGFDDGDDYPNTKPKSKFDDGQYRPSSYANSGVDDCATLSSFYTTMRGETWTPAVDWSGSAVSSKKASCCTWTGVTCDEYERVIGVDVSSLGLSGPLGNELYSLDALLRLDISGNALTSLPDRFDTLPILANINAASNNFTGSVPTTLLTHPTLKTLNLASNGFTGEIAINSVNLTSIALNRNSLTAVRIMEGSGLVKVDLADNQFQGLLPDLSNSPDLQIFDASNNNTGPLFDISRMTSLTRLDVRTNALSGPFPTTLSQLKRLTSLYLSYNAFTGPFPSEPAPPMLASCYITPNPIAPCPSPADLANPNSLAAKCHAACPKAPGTGSGKGSGIPVSPLPGEAGTFQPTNVNTKPLAPAGVYNQPGVNVNNLKPPFAAGTVPPSYNSNGMDASANSIGGTRQQQMVGAAVPVRVANGAVRDSVRRSWMIAGLAGAVAPFILGFAV